MADSHNQDHLPDYIEDEYAHLRRFGRDHATACRDLKISSASMARRLNRRGINIDDPWPDEPLARSR